MGARPSTYRKAGSGFLNNVDGVFVSYEWTDEFNGKPFEPGKVKDARTGKMKDRFHTLYCLITALVDGAEEPVTLNLFAGGYDDYLVSDDGKTLTAPDGGECSLRTNTAAATFFASFTANGFDEMLLSDDPNSINYEPMEGSRVRFGRIKDEDAIKRGIKRPDKKTGKEYDPELTVIEQVYALPGKAKAAAAAPKSAKGAKAAPKVAKAGNGAVGNGAAGQALSAEGIEDMATELILDIVRTQGEKTSNGIELRKEKLAVPILRRTNGHPNSKDVYAFGNSDEKLAESGAWSYDVQKRILTVSS